MKEEDLDSISATELVRNLATVIDKVRMTGNSLIITKGSQTIAKLSPPPKTGFPVNKLADFLAALPALGKDNQSMIKEMERIRKKGFLPEIPWD